MQTPANFVGQLGRFEDVRIRQVEPPRIEDIKRLDGMARVAEAEQRIPAFDSYSAAFEAAASPEHHGKVLLCHVKGVLQYVMAVYR